jgi:dipeptidyl-peptidase III
LKETCPYLTDDELSQLLAYSAGVFNNCGNFRSFGDTKFVPELSPSKMRQIIESYKLNDIWDAIEKEVYCEEDPV